MVTKEIKSPYLQDLLISAGDLADSFLFVDRVDQDGRKVNLVWCNKCRQMALGDDDLVHAEECLAGRVSKLIAAIEGPDVSPIKTKLGEGWSVEKVEEAMFEVLPEDHQRAAELKNLQLLTSQQLRDAYRDLSAYYYAMGRTYNALRAALKLSQVHDSFEHLTRIAVANPYIPPQPTERHIAYEVEEHPWASEEGNCPNLGRAEILTHEEAAADRRGVLS